MIRILLGGVLVAGLVSAPGAASAAAPSLTVKTKSTTVSSTSTVKIAVRCASSKTCRGTLRVRVGTIDSAGRTYAVRSKASKTYAVTLTASQVAKVPVGGSRAGKVRVTETKPRKVATRSVAITLKKAAPPPTEPPKSVAYTVRNWKPTAVDTCPESLHLTHSVVAADGKLYPTWHAPTDTDPATGKSCTYGHEHGDDPTGSDIHDWVTGFLGPDDATRRGIPFGAVTEALDAYSATRDKVQRHEDNVGHKVIVANDVKMVAAKPRSYVRDDRGEVVACDFLIKFHQGSHSADATTNNAHELLYAARCTDGTELISSTMTRFGNPNEFDRSCDLETVETSGSNLPDGFGGRRVIPDRYCVDREALVPGTQQSSIWALYESWESENRIQTADGRVLARFDPWFGVRNPSRAHDAGLVGTTIFALVDTLWMVDAADGGTAKGYPWSEAQEAHEGHEGHLAKTDPASPFDGAQRDYRLGSTTVDNDTGTSIWWSDPYGDNAGKEPFEGAVRQLVSVGSNADWPALERSWVNLEKDYGKDNGVHAPN